MSDTRGAQLRRTLFLLRDLDTGWRPLSTLAQTYGVTTRTIRRDIRFLQGHGFEIQERGWDVSDSQQPEWTLTRWPEKYDLTQPLPAPRTHLVADSAEILAHERSTSVSASRERI